MKQKKFFPRKFSKNADKELMGAQLFVSRGPKV
jgi:hypothetical protein